VTAGLSAELPEYGRNIAIDASDMPAYANGQRYVSKNGPERERYSDPDASWGHRSAVSTRKGGGFYGYRIHASVCTATDLPVAWTVATAREHESTFVASLLHTVASAGSSPRRARSTRATTTAASTASAPTVTACRSSRSARRPTYSAATTTRRHASMATGGSPEPTPSAALPSGVARPASASPRRCGSRPTVCIPLIPRETPRFTALYRRRASVEREFGRLKHQWALAPLRVRGLDRVRLHADLTILAKLACTLARARAVTVAA
jgi:hypothetical protein